jgi:hypothetical protein
LQEDGCAKIAAESSNKQSCVDQCKLGFKSGLKEALDAVK